MSANKKTSNTKTEKNKAAKKVGNEVTVESYRHESAKRKNIPTAKIAAEGIVPRVPKAKYAYSAHLSPELRFDASGQSDRITAIVEKAAAGNKLTKEEADILRGVAANASQPWLEWSGKKEEYDRGVLEVEPVALHIHERVSANAIIRAAKREDVQADLFADPQQEYKDAVQFYKHDVDWANRLILGDSLEVMSSLAKRESLAGKVQLVYMDPPYGIKFASNFQPEVRKREVEEKETDLTRDAEVVKAYRDTWYLGTHSYLSYLRDRLILARDLLTESGSMFVQIGDENVHRVRQIMEEVFGADNFVSCIAYKTAIGMAGGLLDSVHHNLLWFARDKIKIKYRQLFSKLEVGAEGASRYKQVESQINGERRLMTMEERANPDLLSNEWWPYRDQNLTSRSGSSTTTFPLELEGGVYRPPSGGWRTNHKGMQRVLSADRLMVTGKSASFKKFFRDSPSLALSNFWTDTAGGITSRSDPKIYAVQTTNSIIERCAQMTTDPGDLILDPTGGAGTTAYVAEQWGRRWIVIDSSRVAVSLARQRLLTATFDCYKVRGGIVSSDGASQAVSVDPSGNFFYEQVPHITLGSIATNENLDPIFQKYERALDEKLDEINAAVEDLSESVRATLANKLAEKMQNEGLRAASEADVRRWLLPGTTEQQIALAFSEKSKLKKSHVKKYAGLVPSGGRFEHWNVPYDRDPAWPSPFADVVTGYREIWRDRMQEINNCIDANAEQEDLVDKPEAIQDVVRVSGPFTVEGVRPEELSLDANGEVFDPTPNEWLADEGARPHEQNASAYLDRMINLIREDGVTFPNNEHRKFAFVERLDNSASALHAEALWEGAEGGDLPDVAIAFGPQHGPVTASQVEDLIRASRRYDELVIAAFSFDGSSQTVIQESANPRLKIHMAHIRPDVSPGMDGLLKDSPKSQLFTVFGQPEIEVRKKDAEIEVELLGVDIYSPLTGEITSSGANKVAAWFLDSNYDGRCFCITQAFFPNQNAWEKIAKALGSSADTVAFEAFNGTVSLPFGPGKHQRIAVKVIDPRGNEVMAIRNLKDLH